MKRVDAEYGPDGKARTVRPEKKLLTTKPLASGFFDDLGKCGSERSTKPSGTREPEMTCWPTQATICDTLILEPDTLSL